MRVESYDTENSNKPWLVLWSMCARYKGKMMLALSLSALASCAQLLPVYLLFITITELLDPISTSANTLLWVAAGLVAVIVCKTLFRISAYYFSYQVASKAFADVRVTLSTHLARVSLKWLSQQNTGALKQQILHDIKKLENFIAHNSVELFNACLSPLFIFCALCLIDWRLALSAIAVLPLAFFLRDFWRRKTTERDAQFSHEEAGLNTTLYDYVKLAPLMKLHNLDSQRFEILHHKLENHDRIVKSVTHQALSGWAAYSVLLGSSCLFLLPTAIWLYSLQLILIEQFILAVLLTTCMVGPLLKVNRFFIEANDVLASIARITPLYCMAPTENDTTPVQAASKYPILQFYGVDFCYGRASVLKNVHFKLLPNALNVIVGGTGSGKSTIAMLASGLFAPNKGRVQWYGKDVFELTDSARARAMNVVMQESYLFEGTIRDNITFGRSGITTEALEHAIVAAQLKSWLGRQPKGLDTWVEARGINLSRGESIRIAIARALLNAPPLVILDEVCAAMDNLTYAKFYQGLKGHYPNTTFLVITHHYFGLEKSDQILTLMDGTITAQGTHEAMLARCEHYKKGWQLQVGVPPQKTPVIPTPLPSYEN
ncbi:hypothetical protein N473_16575 [Pseudoalteromonas luteoviolacea CPMOR-1]|uniref:ABC transporter domain-containing protein n=1 Tax=Pseudoalteromonas luteoviolacea CPMOR-1 TaxID=1365248 RepID=A0A161YNL5_9GAMM|nr:ABC transporter ATP-binding protein [Pseudoalteromonas luteoviolacea]KZN63436.1 hypothetical protein N473_16575 [Pseudoalteromonas luteoviolacea CPMOR-1]